MVQSLSLGFLFLKLDCCDEKGFSHFVSHLPDALHDLFFIDASALFLLHL